MKRFSWKTLVLWTDVVAFLTLAAIVFHHAPRNGFWIIGLIIAGVGFFLWMLARHQLGRSFTATAQARQLVSNGLYRYFRHPIYLFGAVAHVGVFLALQQVWVLIIWALYAAAIQWPRVKREDKVLEEAFGDEFLKLRERNCF